MNDDFEVGFSHTVHDELKQMVNQFFDENELPQNGDYVFEDSRGEMVWVRYDSEGLQDILVDITDPTGTTRTVAAIYRTAEGFVQCITTMPCPDGAPEPFDNVHAQSINPRKPRLIEYSDLLILDKALNMIESYHEEAMAAAPTPDFWGRFASRAKRGGRFALVSQGHMPPDYTLPVTGAFRHLPEN